ncbi:MAG: LysR family transcriptional regulator [Acidobacteria bacterium]|nr:LysR family transcriptional regulator [Acidobacteriota bacterium]
MTAAAKSATAIRARPRIRILRGTVIAFGPGKADLLDAIRAKGSIRKAAEKLGMSYMRAWHLVQTMNAEFRAPVVSTVRGGERRGGTSVTATGEAVLVLYREMESASVGAMVPAWHRLRPYLRR